MSYPFVSLGTVAHQAPLSMGFPRQEYWSGLPFPTPEDLPDSGIRLSFLASPSLTGRFLATIVTCKRVQWFGGLVAKSCLTDRNPMDYSLPGSSVHGILQVRVLQWVAISYSRGSS